jgi:hypothetical protein
MKYFLIPILLLCCIEGMAQPHHVLYVDSVKLSAIIKRIDSIQWEYSLDNIHHNRVEFILRSEIDQQARGLDSLEDDVDSLQDRIRWLESRPYLNIGIHSGGGPNREVWMIDPRGTYSIILKSFNYNK